MAKSLNRVKMTTATTGTGTVTLGSAVAGFRSYAAAGANDGDVFRNVFEDGSAWEVSKGTYTASGTTLSRTLIASSTGSLLNLSGSATVFPSVTREDLLDLTRPAALARRVAIMGHSIPSYTTSDDGTTLTYGSTYLNLMNMISGQRLVISHALNKGVSGNTTNQMIARFAADIIANQDLFDILMLDAGTNDLYGGTAIDKDVTYANITSMAQQALDLGKLVIIMAIWPRSDQGTYPKEYAYVNRKVMEWSRTKAGVIYVDPWWVLADYSANNGYALSGTLWDNLHPTSYGSYLVASYMWPLLKPFFANLPTQWRNPIDVYNSTSNPAGNSFPNPLLTGTGGSFPSQGATTTSGVGPDNTQIYKGAGSAATSTAVSSVFPNVDGSPGNSHQFRFDCSVGGSATEEFYIGNWIGISGTGLVVGDSAYGQVEIELVGPAIRMKSLEVRFTAGFDYGGLRGTNVRIIEQLTNLIAIPGKFVVRTPAIVLPATTNMVNLTIYLAWDASSPAYGLVRYSQPQIRKVV